MAPATSTLDLEIVRRLAVTAADGTPVSPALASLLITDSLTDLYNRAYFHERLRMELAAASAHCGLALLVIDVDRFKEFNDRFGHRVGDLALKAIAAAIQAVIPRRGAPCRVGGDEFAVIVPRVTVAEAEWLQVEVAQEIARRQVPYDDNRVPLRLSASVGLALAPDHAQDPEGLFHRADTAMYAAKRQGATPTVTALPLAAAQAPLVGRETLLAQAKHRLEAASSGQGSLLLFTGPPGTGKTRLAEEVARRSGAIGFIRLPAAAMDGTPMGSVLRAAADLAHVIGEQRVRNLLRRHWVLRSVVNLGDARPAPGSVRPTHAQVAAGLRLLLAAAPQPVLWLCDDLQAADVSTLAVLEHLASALPSLPVLLVATARLPAAGAPLTPEHSPLPPAGWERLLEQPGCVRLEVPPLSPAAAQELAQWALGNAVAPETIQQLPAVASGNPLLILRMAAGQAREEWPTHQDLDLPDLLAAQLAALAEQPRRVLEAAAVLGHELSVTALLQVAPETPDDFHHALDLLVVNGWLLRGDREDGAPDNDGSVRFAHPLVREVVYKEMPLGLRRSLHRLAAHALCGAAGHPPADIARHFDEGGDWQRAGEFHRRAGRAAEGAFAYTEAAQHYRRCLYLAELTGRIEPDAAELAIRAGDLFQLRAEDMASAQEMLQFALQHCRTAQDRGRTLYKLANLHYLNTRMDLFMALNTEATPLLRRAGPSPELAAALARQVRIEGFRSNVAGARILAGEALSVAQSLGDPVAEIEAVAALGFYLLEAQEVDQADECLAWAEFRWRSLDPRANRRRDDPRLPTLLKNLGQLTGRLGYFGRAMTPLRSAQRLTAASGDVHLHLLASLIQVAWLLEAGRLPEALGLLHGTEPLVRRSNARFRHYQWLELMLRAHLLQGNLAEAERYVAPLTQVGQATDPDFSRYASALVAWYDLDQGRQPDPQAWAPSALLPVPMRSGLTSTTLLTGARVQLGAGELDAAQTLVDAARRHLVNRYELSGLEWVQGQIHLVAGRTDAAAAALAAAADCKRPGQAYYQALAHRDLARLLPTPGGAAAGGQGARHRQARAHLQSARRLFTRIGNPYALDQVNGYGTPALRDGGRTRPGGQPPR